MKIKFTIIKQILDLNYDAVLCIDKEGKLSFWNESAGELFHLSSDAENVSFYEICTDDSVVEAMKSGEDYIEENLAIGDRIFLIRSRKIETKSFHGRLLVFTEVTEQETIKAELFKAKQLKDELDAIIQASYDYIFVTDGKGNIRKINDAYTRITGLEVDKLIGKNMYDLVDKGFFDRAATIDVIETKKSVTFTQSIKTGKTVLVTGNPIFADNGELAAVVTNGRDITELNRLKQEVKQADSLRKHYQKELQKIQLEGTGDYIIASAKMAEVSDLIMRIAKVDSTVLINGESGVGKEFVAREIHRNSLRADRPYICINCAAIPDNLLESELFGYEPGAFTGANKGGKLGIFQLADGGTLFLDEIGELPFYLQAKLLRVIQENEILRIGGTTPIPIDVRLISATNRNLWQMVQDGKFREDFYYRLNVIQVRIPPLRERSEEIPVFADYFIGLLNKKYKLNKRLDPLALDRLMCYEWPGNIRELRNALEYAFVVSPGPFITDIKLGPQQIDNAISFESEPHTGVTLKEALQKYEHKLIRDALQLHTTTRKAASALGVSQATIWRKAKQYGIALTEE